MDSSRRLWRQSVRRGSSVFQERELFQRGSRHTSIVVMLVIATMARLLNCDILMLIVGDKLSVKMPGFLGFGS